MRLSPPLKILTGLATAIYLASPIFILLFFFLPMLLIPAAEHSPALRDPEAIFALFPLLMFPVIICYNTLHFGLQILYVVLVNKDRRLSETPRILFTLGLFFLPFVAMPLYFILYLWKDASPVGLPDA